MFNLNDYFNVIPLKTNNRFIIIHGDSKVTLVSGNPVKENQSYADWFVDTETSMQLFTDEYIPTDLKGIFKIQWANEVKPYCRSVGYVNTLGNTSIDHDLCQQFLDSLIPEMVSLIRSELPVEHDTYYSIIALPDNETPAHYHVFQGNAETVTNDGNIAIVGSKDSFSIGTVENKLFTAPYTDIICDYTLIISNVYTLVEEK